MGTPLLRKVLGSGSFAAKFSPSFSYAIANNILRPQYQAPGLRQYATSILPHCQIRKPSSWETRLISTRIALIFLNLIMILVLIVISILCWVFCSSHSFTQNLIYSVEIPIHFPLYQLDLGIPHLHSQDKQDHSTEQILPFNSQNQKYTHQTLTNDSIISDCNRMRETDKIEKYKMC